MLLHLSISNFAIIKQLEFSMKSGLNVLSGETGAGKSIIINAMNLILGGRASAELIRSGCNEASVEALFEFPENRLLTDMLSKFGFSFKGELLIKRSIFREGRNRILINGSMATLHMLSRLGSILISISGQHEHQLLLKPDNHLYLLDDFGNLSDERLDLNKLFNAYQLLKDEINHLKREITDAGERHDLTQFQIQEIETAEISPGEDVKVGEEKRRLQHSKELLEIVTEGYQRLYERNDSVLSSISQCTKRLDKGAEIDPGLAPFKESLSEIEIKLEDTSLALRDYEKNVQLDPNRLEELEERLERLNDLKRKYGPTLEDVLKYKIKMSSMMYDLDEKKEKRDKLERERRDLATDLISHAAALSKKRQKAARGLEKAVEKELKDLHMAETKFKVKFDEDRVEQRALEDIKVDEVRLDGLDQVEFMISPNVGEELRPLARIASGGELSRIMLALKTILARTGSVETVIFDEVDSGISGATAEVIGEKLSSLATYHQILCITHLPQIASQGQNHFLVSKEVLNGRTQTSISGLEPEERVREIARLLGGKEITERAVAHAREMLGN
jgi:DNA repair protein RecN (Recombination protein N)